MYCLLGYGSYLNGGEDYYWHDQGSGQGNRSVPTAPAGQCKQCVPCAR